MNYNHLLGKLFLRFYEFVTVSSTETGPSFGGDFAKGEVVGDFLQRRKTSPGLPRSPFFSAHHLDHSLGVWGIFI